jgi:hypothetical protein
MIVDFTVEDDPDVARLITERLVTGLNIDDAEAAHGQADVVFDKKAIIVGTAVHNLAVHCRQRFAIYVLRTVRIEDAADSAHD